MASTETAAPSEEPNPDEAHTLPDANKPPNGSPLKLQFPPSTVPRGQHFYTSSDGQSSIADFIIGGGGSFSQVGSQVGDGDDFSQAAPYGLNLGDGASVFGATTSGAAPKGPKLVKGFVEYISDLESRVKQLESQLSLHFDEPKTPSTVRDEEGLPLHFDNTTTQPFKFEMKFFDVAAELGLSGNFKMERETMRNTFRSNVDFRHFLRVAYTWRDDTTRAHVPPETGDGEQQPMPDDIKVFALRLDSPHVTSFLRALSGDVIERGTVVELIAPFRILIENYHQIRGHLVELQSHMQLGEGKTDPCQQMKMQEAVDHFHLLLQFMDLYLARDLGVYEDLKQAKTAKISFENLWMLFGFDETIYCPARRGADQEISNMLGPEMLLTESRAAPQAYRVLGAMGGLPTIISVGHGHTRQQPSLDNNPSPVTPNDRGDYVSIRDKFGPLHVYCFYVDYDGQRYGAMRDVFVFKPFEGEVDVTSLEAYPLRFMSLRQTSGMDSSIKHADDLVERGRKFIQLTATSHMNYEGLTASDYKEEIASPVIVDMKLAFQESPHLTPKFASLLDFWPKKTSGQMIQIAVSDCVHHDRRSRCCNHWKCMRDADVESRRLMSFDTAKKLKRHFEDSDETAPEVVTNGNDQDSLAQLKLSLEEANLIQLLPGVVHGYALRNRKWVKMDLEIIQPIVQEDGWKNLVLPSGHKQIVQAMVDTHSAGPRIGSKDAQRLPQVDLVRGKGKGCIILIHGAPGVGKTSTAECVAAYTNRPLFPITCGDIGYQPAEVERKLEKLFNLALKWGCVLLLDEADVFLAKRNKDDVKRNGLVSVFLRMLEYYSGILFLTTNRVGAIDDAFRSRLHLTLYYPRLDMEKSIKIWKMNIKRLNELSKERAEQGRPGISMDKKRLIKFATDNFNLLQWNGRQIRNSFQTALALAEFGAAQRSSKEMASSVVSINTSSCETKITVKHFRTIALASLEFEEYLQQTHGRSEEKQAHYDKMRVEEYKDPGIRLSLKVQEESPENSDASTTDNALSESDLGSDLSNGNNKKKSVRKSKSRDSLYSQRPNMNRQKSRDSIISLKKVGRTRSSMMMDEEYYPPTSSGMRRQKSRESIISLKKGKRQSGGLDENDYRSRTSNEYRRTSGMRKPKLDYGEIGESDSNDSDE